MDKKRLRQWFPTLKYNIFVPTFEVKEETLRKLHRTFRRLNRAIPLISIDELAFETNLPPQVVISGMQSLSETKLELVKFVITEMGEFIAPGEMDEVEITEEVRKFTGSSYVQIISKPLTYAIEHLNLKNIKPKEWKEDEEKDLKHIDKIE